MNLDIAIATVKSATKGANIKLAWTRPCKTKKSCVDSISKSVRTSGRIGIDYNNQKAVIEKRENGELPAEAQAIWHGKGEFEIFPYLIRHTVTGQRYLRLYTSTGSDKATVQYYRNGIPVSLESVSADLLASEKKTSKGDCFCCKVEDMTDISWTPSVSRDSITSNDENEVTTPATV